MTDIELKRSTGGVYFSTLINEGAKRMRKLMEEDYITLPISTQNPLDIRLGDYVDIPNEGRFCIIETQYPSVNEENGGYDYDLKFEAQYRKWGNKIFKYQPDSGAEELSWKLTANIEVHTEQIKKAINALGAKNPSYKYNGTLDWDVRFDSTIDHKVAKFISFDNINILDAISAIAEAFECEWWVDDNILKFGRCEIGDTEVVLSKEINLTSISRSDTGEKIANRIYPFGSTENLPKSYREDLVFYITNYDINDRTFSDKIRPLSHKWFDKSDIELSPNATTTIKASQLQGTKSGNISANVAPQSSENVLAFSKSVELSNLPYGTNRFDLTGVNISVSCSTDNNRVLSSILAEVVVSWEYLNESGVIIGRDSVSTQLIGAYIASIGQTYSIVLPESLNAKIEQFYPNANGIKEQVTTINCKLLLNVYCQFSATGTANVNISTMNTTGILVYAPQDVYRIKLNIKFLSGELDGNTYEAYYNNTFAREEEYANVIYLNNADVELLTTGDAFEITNINEAWIPVSYFSESMHSLDKDTINAIADKRLLLPEGMKPYIDAYRYANGDKVYIGEDGYDDATEMPLEEAQEDVVIFEDIKPDYTFEITKVWEESKEMTEDGVKRIVYKFFFYEDLFGRSNQFGEQYRIEGKDLMIRFSSGQLNGMEFKLHYWNETDYPTRFEVEVDENSNLPNKFFKPVVGDTFTMSGLNTAIINIEYLPKAEQRLFKKSTEYLIKSNLDNSAYDCIIKSEVMFGEDALVLDMGQRVFLKEETFLKEGRHSRVIGYEYPLDIPYDNPKYTIGEKASYSRIGDIESKLDNIEFSLSGEEHNNASTIIQSGFGNYIIGTNDDTSPSNTNVLSSLRSFVEFTSRIANESINYLWKFFKGIEIGNYLKGIRGASITQDGDAEVNSLQSRNGIISNNIHTTDFAQGALMGVGGAMYQLNGATYAEFDYLTARKGATFAELIIQEYRSIGGALVISQANGEIERVYDYGNGYNIWLKDDDRGDSLFANRDLVRCQYWDRAKNELVYYWTPVSVSEDLQGRYVLTIYKKDMNGVVPQVGDKLVQMGNTTDTSRQGCILLTTENSMPRMAILDGINSTILSNANYKAIYGSLDGFTDPYPDSNGNYKTLSGYGMWGENVYLHGDMVLSSTTTTISSELANVNNALTNTKALIDEEIREINNRLDGVVTNWFGDDVPRLDNHPAEQWTTEQEKMNHIGDTYTNTETTGDNAGRSWRWVQENGEYKWIQIADSDAVKALDWASKAQSTADGKRRVFVNTPTTPYDKGDLWVKQNGEKATLYYSIIDKAEGQFSESDWLIGATDDTAIKDLQIGGTNLLVGTNQGVNNWSFSSSLSSYTAKEISYNGASGVQIIKSNPLEYADWEVIKYPLRSELIKKGKKYHLTFDFMQSAENDGVLALSISLNNSNGNNSLTNAVSLNSKDISGVWQHFDVEFTAIANGNKNDGRIIYFNIHRNTNEWKDFAIANLKLEEGNKATTWSPSPEDAESALILLKTETTAEIEKLDDRITQSVTETKTYADGKVETLKGYVDTKADEVSLGVKTDLERTGIDITEGNIVAKTKNFEIQNQNGNTTARINAEGLIEGTSGFATTYPLAGAPAPHINKLDEKLTFYHMSGNKALEIGIDNDTNSFIRVYDENGNMTWKLGTEAKFLTDETVVTYSPLNLIAYSNVAEIPEPEAGQNLTEGAKNYYKEQSVLDTNGVVRLEPNTTSSVIPDGIYALAGYPTPVRVPASNDGIELKYRRTYYRMQDGKIAMTSFKGYLDKIE